MLTYAEHAAEIFTKAAKLIGSGQRFALITSVGIEGGAAREVGSLALVTQDGAMIGYLSNGCIDRDIQLHAVAALQSDEKKLIRYGDGSRFADLQLPCGGALDVLIDPNPRTDDLRAAKRHLMDAGQSRSRLNTVKRVGHTSSPICHRSGCVWQGVGRSFGPLHRRGTRPVLISACFHPKRKIWTPLGGLPASRRFT